MESQARQPADQPSSIGRYQLISELGRGAMARVYLALDPNIDRKVALKVLDPAGRIDDEMHSDLRRRFLLEARAAGKLRHPSAVAIYDADHDPETGLSYIAMEWVDGESLDRLLTHGRTLPMARAVTIVRQVASALDAAHRQGLIHRDIKAANILVDRQGNAKLSDFGIVKLEELDLTNTGQILGTPNYMSPEQVRDEPLDGRSDLFSLGVVLYQCLTGRLPFAARSLAGVTHKILNIDPRPVRWLDEDISQAVGAAVSKALAKDPEARFQTAAELAEALDRAIDRPRSRAVVPAVGDLRPTSSRSDTGTVVLAAAGAAWHKRVGVAAALVLAVVILAALAWRWSGAPEPAAEPRPEPAAELRPEPSPVTEVRSPEPQPAPPSAAEENAVVGQARLEIAYTNRLKRGWIAVWVDDRQVLSRSLKGPKGVVKRAVGQDFRHVVTVDPGHHEIAVQVSGQSGKLEARNRTSHHFDAGQARRLRVDFIPPSFLRLAWKEASDD